VWSNFFNEPESFFAESERLLPDSAIANCATNRSGNINISRNHIGDLDARIKQFTPNNLLWLFNFHYLMQITVNLANKP
jgi:hypothetical protein